LVLQNFDWKVAPAMMDELQVEKREQTGSLAARRLRRAGQVPAVLYGHGQGNENLAIPQKEVQVLLRHHGKMVQLRGAVEDTALVSDLQWDPLGIEVLHMDLIRVNLKESVEVTVPIHAHGDAAGTHEGGMFLQNAHEVTISCPAGSIPENVGLDISGIHMGEHRTAGDLELPEGAELVTPADTVVAHVEKPRGAEAEEEGVEGTEPIVIGGAEKEAEES
jgi:large subunit ribosomal protein L25